MLALKIKPFDYPTSFWRYTWMLLFICCWSFNISAQQTVIIDSLQNLLDNETDITARAIIEIELSDYLVHSDPNKAIALAERALIELKKVGHPKLSQAYLGLAYANSIIGKSKKSKTYLDRSMPLVNSPSEQATAYNLLGQFHFGADSMKFFFNKYFEIVQKHQLFKQIPAAYQQIGLAYAIDGNMRIADSLWQIGLANCSREEFDNNKQTLLYNLAVLHMQDGNYKRVFSYANDGYELSLKTDDIGNKIGYLNILAKVSLHQKDTFEMIQYWEEAYDLIEKHEYYSALAGDVFYELGNFYLTKNDHVQAIEKAQKLVDLGQRSKSKIDESSGYALLARISMKTKLKDQALSYVGSALKDTASMNNDATENDVLLTGADVFFNYQKYNQANQLLNQIESNLHSNFNLKSARNMAELRYKIYKKQNRWQRAMEALELYKSYSDEFKDNVNSDNLLDAKVKFDSERKQLELNEQTAKLNLLTQKSKTQKMQLVFGGIGLLGLFGFVYIIRSLRFARVKSKLQSEYAQNLINGQESERKRIARELHDGVGQNLILLKNQLNQDESKAGLVGKTLDEVRSVSRGLHPFVLERMGLSVAIENLVEEVDGQTEVFFDTEIDFVDKDLPKDKHLHIYRIIQEAITNLIKYSDSPSAQISIKNQSDHVQFLIRDHGKGMQMDETFIASSLGMKTMAERASIIGGSLQIDTKLGNGTSVILTLKK